MTSAADYIAFIKSTIVANSTIKSIKLIREEAQGEVGLFRYRLFLQNNDTLEIFERFEVITGQVNISKYSFHWQSANGTLLKRWDNAPHHPEIATHPHHLHNGADENVFPHAPVSALEIIKLVGEE